MIINLILAAVVYANVGAIQPIKTGFSDSKIPCKNGTHYCFSHKPIEEWVK